MRHPLLVYCVGIFAASWALQIAGLYAVGGNVEKKAITPWADVGNVYSSSWSPAVDGFL